MANVIFFSAQFNNNSNKKNYPTHKFNPTQPNPCGLGWTYVMGWVGSNFFDLPWWVGSKNSLNSTQSDRCTLLKRSKDDHGSKSNKKKKS